jgi:hypothetical protein
MFTYIYTHMYVKISMYIFYVLMFGTEDLKIEIRDMI